MFVRIVLALNGLGIIMTRTKSRAYILGYTTTNVSKRCKQKRDEVRAWLELKVDAVKNCPYCGVDINLKNFGIDHIHPIARGGDFGLQNCHIICKSCNKLKGELTDTEFRQLMTLIKTLDPIAQRSITSRLKFGGGKFK